jgi:NAD(P)-dependent dehydrogenase (short-subunit alcohol dehydrogenase family)
MVEDTILTGFNATHTSEPDRVILITGGTSGIGLHLALALAHQNARLILVGHRPEHAQQAMRRIDREVPQAAVDLQMADLSRLDDVRSLAEDIRARYGQLDALINNSGGIYLRRGETADGFERTFALNHLSPFLLTHELLPLLRRSTPSRIVITASEAHRGAKLHLDDLQLRRGYNVWTAYAQSKLANVMFTYELARRLAGEPISVNCFHPGLVRTNLAKNNPVIRPFMSLGFWLLGRDPAEAARQALPLIVSDRFQEQSGSYVIDGKPVRSSTISYDETAAHRLWAVSQQLTGNDDDWGFDTG